MLKLKTVVHVTIQAGIVLALVRQHHHVLRLHHLVHHLAHQRLVDQATTRIVEDQQLHLVHHNLQQDRTRQAVRLLRL